ncbi:MAG: ThiF family adenylyltransferase [Euryarchaeota archaeon]|nr:ThiF family adenylyltransferase [Euryarchaeota archaeon]
MWKRPRLKRSWQKLRQEDGVIVLLNELSNDRLRIRDERGVAWSMLQALETPHDPESLVGAIKGSTGADAEEILGGLESLGEAGLLEETLIEPPPVPAEYGRAYKRNLYFFKEYETQERDRNKLLLSLYNARVAVLGLGGTGSWVISSLLAAGVGTLRGADGDDVGPENLGRQTFYRRRDIGKAKTQAMADEVADFNPAIRFEARQGMVRSVEDVAALIKDCDFLVVGCVGPRFTLFRWVNEACLAAGVPFIVVQTRAVGPMIVPGHSACYTCYEGFLRENHPYYDQLVASLDTNKDAAREMPQFGPLVAYSSARAGLEVVRYLSGYAQPDTIDCILQLNGPDLEWNAFKFSKDPDCISCGTRDVND